MDTQLSRFYLAAQPLHRLMVQFRANGSHTAACSRPPQLRKSGIIFDRRHSGRWRRLTPAVGRATGEAYEEIQRYLHYHARCSEIV